MGRIYCPLCPQRGTEKNRVLVRLLVCSLQWQKNKQSPPKSPQPITHPGQAHIQPATARNSFFHLHTCQNMDAQIKLFDIPQTANLILPPQTDKVVQVDFNCPKKGDLQLNYQRNDLTNDVMWWWSTEVGMSAGPFSEIRVMLKNIAKRHRTYSAKYVAPTFVV